MRLCSSRCEGGRGGRGLSLEKSLDRVRMELLLRKMMMMVDQMVVVMPKRQPVVKQPVFRGLRHSLEHHPSSPRSLDELLDGGAVLVLILLLLLHSNNPTITPDCLSCNHSPDTSIWTSRCDQIPFVGGENSTRVQCTLIGEFAGYIVLVSGF